MTEFCSEEGKVIYKSQQEAYVAGRSVKKYHGGNIRAYKCNFCGFYHVTSQQDKYAKKRTLHKKGR